MPLVAPGVSPGGCSRRHLLLAGIAVPLSGALALPRPTAAAAPAPAAAPAALQIHPRTDWAAGLSPTGPLEVERPGEVRYLLVHHTASSNSYRPDQVVGQLRSFFGFHTGRDKRWPDLAYNFLVDRYGGVWEGRTGSLDGPVRGSATGGSQGYDQLACFIGDHGATPPTEQARASMLALLAVLADRYDIDTSPGASVSFVSRGSNRWPAGVRVTTPPLAGHRDMSLTTCPGDAVYGDIRTRFPAEVTALRSPPPAGKAAPPAPGRAAAPLPSAANPPAPPAAPSRATPPAPPAAPSPTAAPATAGPGGSAVARPDSSAGPDAAAWTTGGALVAAAATGTYAVRRRRDRSGEQPAPPDSPR